MTYRESQWTERQAQELDGDKGLAFVGQTNDVPRMILPSGKSLAQLDDGSGELGKMLMSVRGLRTREYWQTLVYDKGTDEDRRLIDLVWKLMPGDCCRWDAARLIARKY